MECTHPSEDELVGMLMRELENLSNGKWFSFLIHRIWSWSGQARFKVEFVYEDVGGKYRKVKIEADTRLSALTAALKAAKESGI